MQLLKTSARSVLGLCLTEKHLSDFETYYEALTTWNDRFNLTAVIGRREVQIKHFLDSLTCLLAMPSLGTNTWCRDTLPIEVGYRPLRCLDVGAGAGFPGLPLKIVRSELELDLVEATLKKTTFLQHMLKRLDLLKVGVFHARAEELGQDAAFRGEYDVVLARAVAKLPTLAEYCLPFCKIGGRFIAQKGSSAPEELETAQEAIEILGGQVREAKELRIAEMAQHRYLIVIEKVAPTPAKYPRRPGMPAKRPL